MTGYGVHADGSICTRPGTTDPKRGTVFASTSATSAAQGGQPRVLQPGWSARRQHPGARVGRRPGHVPAVLVPLSVLLWRAVL